MCMRGLFWVQVIEMQLNPTKIEIFDLSESKGPEVSFRHSWIQVLKVQASVLSPAPTFQVYFFQIRSPQITTTKVQQELSNYILPV